jgi:hypothetical protein
VVEFLDAIQILIPNFLNYANKLQILSMHVILLYIYFNAATSLPVCCNTV